MDFEGFRRALGQLFPEAGGDTLDRFKALEALYNDWNAKINVISRKDMDGLYLHHVLHSLSIAKYLELQRPEDYELLRSGRASVLDLGTGGGFPGIPLAILFPAAAFLLCDSVGKKITVASGVASSLELENVRTANVRAESLTEKFDFVVSRAVTSLENFYPWVKGKFSRRVLYLKGGDVVEEIATMMGRFRLPKGSVSVFPVRDILADAWFDGKYVIDIATYNSYHVNTQKLQE